MRKSPWRAVRRGKSSKSSEAILPSPRRSGSFLKMPLLALGPVGTIPVRPVGWGKVDGSLRQEHNYPRKKMGEARSFSFSHYPLIPVDSINYPPRPFPRAAPQAKGQIPLTADGQNDLQRRAFDPSPSQNYSKNFDPPAEISVTSAKW